MQGARRLGRISALVSLAFLAGCIGNAGSGSYSDTGEASEGDSYTVMAGDTLWGIARAHGLPLQSLIDANATIPAPYVLRVGQLVSLPRAEPSPAAAALEGSGPITGASYVVRSGDTFYEISRRSGIAVTPLAEANALTAPYAVQVGQVLIMPDVPRDPSFVQAVAQQAAAAPAGQAPADLAPAASGQTLPAQTTTGQTTTGPTVTTASVAPAAANDPLTADPASLEGTSGVGQPADLTGAAAAAQPSEVAVVEESQQAVVVETANGEAAVVAETQVVAQQGSGLSVPQGKPARSVALPVAAQANPPPPSNAALPAPPKRQGRLFDWPVAGKVISKFGPKKGGLHNDGINIAAPAGTPVRAAESGVVAYTGGDLKGFGKLVLIKHQDGYVTAYAHNSQVLVRRGETVRRGDVIARVGETGNVDTPQLHFEIRKEAKPVDPNGLMAGGG